MNILKINGQALEGIYVDAAISFNKPAKRVSTYSVPGRNGDLVIDEGTFDNVLITYPVFEKSTFPTKFDEIVNYLASLEGYQRIECSNDPQHFRLGRFVVPQDPTAKRLNKDGYYTLSFDCKPQRWLLSGEEDTEIDANPIDEYSGDIVSFEAVALDEITELKAAIEPVQNLNGQTSPYPAGGGKNLYDDSTIIHGSFTTASVTTNSNEAYRTVKLTLPAGTYTFSCDLANCFIIRGVWDGAVHAINLGAARYTFTSTEEGTVAFCIRNTSTSTITDTVHAQVEIGSTATAYAPYSNICPISGHTEVNVVRAGKNLLPNLKALRDTKYVYLGQSIGSNAYYGVHLKAGTYTISCNNSVSASLYIKGSTQSSVIVNSAQLNNYGTVTLPIEDDYAIWLYRSAGITTDDVTQFQLELGSTATTYEPYAGQTYPISLGQTVYGGTLNVTTGVLTIDRAMVTLNGSENWSAHGSIASWFYLDSVLDNSYVNLNEKGFAISNKYIQNYYSFAAVFENGQFGIGLPSGGSHNRLVVKDTAYTTVAQFKSALETSPLQVCYELATPTTVQLTAAEVELLLGQNNIWADTGDVEVKVTTPTVFNNPSPFNSKPLIRVYGVGTFRVNDITVTIASHDKPYIDIDCELQECYYGSENMNEYVSFSGNDFPELQPGDNYMLLASGITKLVVTPRWWIL